jgi:alkylation response protein AidB-like acyl-CoA dehydrogenase
MYERFCRAAVDGGLFNSLATEPKLGSPSRGAFFDSTAKPHQGGYLINGHKTWATGGRHLTHLLVSVSLADEETGDSEPAIFLVEGHRAGINWLETWGGGLSLRATDSHEVKFEDVWVPAENFISRRRKKDTTRKGQANAWFPMVLAAVYLGAALGARNALIRYALERVPTALGKPIATLPKIQRQIGELDMALQAARCLLLAVAAEWDGSNYWRVASAKHFAVSVANEVTDKALAIAGGASLTAALPLERHFRDVRAGLMQPPAGDTALEIIGKGAIESIAPLPESE